MSFRIAPWWWPLLAVTSPVLAPLCLLKKRRYDANLTKSERVNRERMERAERLDLPELDSLELTALVEGQAEPGFVSDPAVSYLLRSDRGALIYDVGFGPTRPALAHNAAKLEATLDAVDAVAISHLHPDHMGGIKATRRGDVLVPTELGAPQGKTCFLPDIASASGFTAEIVQGPCMLSAGMGTTGPLARSLFFAGWTEEMPLIARLKGKGLVVITGCGHPTIEVILKMVRRLSDEPIYAIAGGLHFPVTAGRGSYGGIQLQMLVGTGKPPWKRITDADLERTITSINDAGPTKVFLSPHDTCDYALARFKSGLTAETEFLKAGGSYRF